MRHSKTKYNMRNESAEGMKRGGKHAVSVSESGFNRTDVIPGSINRVRKWYVIQNSEYKVSAKPEDKVSANSEDKVSCEGNSGRLSNYILTALMIMLLTMIPKIGARVQALTGNFLRTCCLVLMTVMLSASGMAQTLFDYQRIAAENNPGLQAEYKEYEAALEKIPQVSSLSDPSFSFGYFLSPVETRVGPQRAKFSLTQMFPWFGTLKAQGDAAALAAESRYHSFLDARNNLYYRVAAAYYPLYELEKVIAIEEKNIEILESYRTIAHSKFKNDNSPMVNVLRVEIMLEDARTNLNILREKRKPLATSFNTLLNRDPGVPVEVADSVDMETLSDNYRRDSLYAGQPALDALKLKAEASRASEEAAVKQGLPKIGAGLDYVIVGEGPLNAADNGKDVLMPMVSVTIPIFRGKYRSAVREAQLNQEKFSLQKEEYSNTLEAGYDMATFELEQQQQLLELYRKQVQTSQQSLNLLFSAYGNSGKEFEEVLRMQQQLLKYEKLAAAAEAKYHVALARINYLTAKNLHSEPLIIGN
jgi:outer membrane protein, heavy metal efflux system